MTAASNAKPLKSQSFNFLDGLARGAVARQLHGLRGGEIVLRDVWGSASFGRAGGLTVNLQVHRPRFFRQAVLGGSLAVADSYLRGDWDCDDLTTLFRIFLRDDISTSRIDRGMARLAGLGHRLYHWWNGNSRSGSRRNIAAHYDLGNAFYRLWLDETLAYSSAIFPQPRSSLEEASLEKFDRVCRKLDLRPSDEVLEIGTGWGGFAVHAAERYGCRLTTTTISREQFDIAKQRIQDRGLSQRVSLLQQDYRDLQGEFDKLVSIEMIEAVGHQYLDQFFRQCGRLLRSDGSLVLQAIVMPERDHDKYLKSVDFIQRYVFPGGCLPSVASILGAVGRSTDLRVVHVEDFAPHYAETLRRWRRSFQSKLHEVKRLGSSDEFIRLWTYYLCYCEAAFEERYVGVVQMQFDKPKCTRDPIELSRLASGSHRGPLAHASVLNGDAHGFAAHVPSLCERR